jgi:hypothetical protein
MRAKIEELCADPLFQLNLSIWLAQPKPVGISVRPVFYLSGFNLMSISPLLALPPDIRLLLSEANIKFQDGASPDLILEAEEKTKLVALECKRSSFGADSSTAEQARTFLTLAGPIFTEVLGIGRRPSPPGVLCYLTRLDQKDLLEGTLMQLSQEINKINIETGNYGCLGIVPDGNAISLHYSDDMMSHLNFSDKSPVQILPIEQDTDPRPLYFIPYDPNIDQSGKEQAISRRILYERFLGHILAKIGQAKAPCEIIYTSEQALLDVTFGLYEIWDDAEAKKHMRRLMNDFMNSLLNWLKPDLQEYLKHEKGKGWVLSIKTQQQYKEILNQVSRFKSETLDLEKTIEPSLFDE